MTDQPAASRLERVLNLLTVVRAGEARTALMLALNVFLILMAYYILKTVREALILGEGTAEFKSYLSAGQVVVLSIVVPLYGALVSRFPRMKLINTVTVFFIACPPIFYVLAQLGVPLGAIYFVWIGVFSLMIVSQFWSFANDIYSKEEGERLLVIVGLGASLGAVAGARAADWLIEPVGVLQLMLLGAIVLALQLMLLPSAAVAQVSPGAVFVVLPFENPGADSRLDWLREGVALLIADVLDAGDLQVVPRDRKSTRLNSSHQSVSRMPSSA